MMTFWTLLKESIIVQSLLTIMIWGVILYLYAIGNPVPEPLLHAGEIILGFWVGSKVGAGQGERKVLRQIQDESKL